MRIFVSHIKSNEFFHYGAMVFVINHMFYKVAAGMNGELEIMGS